MAREEEEKEEIVYLTLVNGWENDGGIHAIARARKINGIVTLEGLVKHDNPVQSVIATLPSEFRPKSGSRMFSRPSAVSYSARLEVFANGDISLVDLVGDKQWVPLDNVVYRV